MNHQVHSESGLNQVLADCAEAVNSSFSFAFQPVVEANKMRVHGHEALVRGLSQESAESVIAAIRPENQYFFDQACRMRALEFASRLNVTGFIHLNCTHIRPENLGMTMSSTRTWSLRCGIDPKRVVLEFSDLKPLGSPKQLHDVQVQARRAGFQVLADNFGSSEVGLKRLAVLRPQFVKLDRTLIRGIDRSIRRQAIVSGIIATCRALGVEIIANGVEHAEEASWLKNSGIRLCQGFLFARPAFEAMPEISSCFVAA